MKTFRTVVLMLAAVLLLPAWALFTRSSEDGSLFGLYSPRYAALLLAYTLIVAGVVALAALARPPLRDALTKPLRAVPALLYPVLALAFVEGWYWVYHQLTDSQRFGLGARYQTLLWTAALALLWAFLVMVLAGRSGDDLKNTAFGLAAAGLGLGLVFVVYSFGFALVLDRENYRAVHDLWGTAGRPDPDLAYRLRPNLVFDAEVEPGEQRSMSLDFRGFRAVGSPVDSPVAAFGDSFLFGIGVDDADLWSLTLAEHLEQPVYNYGVFGYHLWQYNRLAERHADEHDLLIVAIFANDIRNESDLAAEPAVLRRWQLRPTRGPIRYTLRKVFTHSPIENLRHLLTPPAGTAPQASEAELPYGYAPICVQWTQFPIEEAYYRTLLDETIHLAEESDTTLLVTTLPSKELAHARDFQAVCDERGERAVRNQFEAYRFICEYVQAAGHHCLNLTADFSAAAQREQLYLQQDGHWNARGHAVFADLLAAYITENGLLDE